MMRSVRIRSVMSMQDSLTLGFKVFSVGIMVVAIGIVQYVLMQSSRLMEMEAFAEGIQALSLFDYAAPAVLVGTFSASMYLSARVQAKPVFLPFSFLFLIVATLVGYIFSVIPAEMAQQTVVGEVIASLGLTNLLLGNLHMVILVTGLVGMITLYGLQTGDRGGGRRAPL